MDFNLKVQCDFLFHKFCCALPKETRDVEVTIWTMDGIHTYRRDRTTQVASYSPWKRQVKSFSSLRKKIAEYEEEKRRSLIPFTPVRGNKFGKKRSRRSQKSRKYRRLDTGCFVPSTVMPALPTTTTNNTTVNLCSLQPS